MMTILREADVAALASIYADIAGGAPGTAVFLAGDDTEGRRDVMRALSDRLRRERPRPVVLGGQLDGDELRPWEGSSRVSTQQLVVLAQALELAKLAPLAAFGLPAGVTVLLAQIMATSKDLVAFVAKVLGTYTASEAAARVLPDTLLELCRRGPAVCLLDGVDARAVPLWSALAGLLAPRIATDLPVLLVLGLDGPRDLHEAAPHESEHLGVARELTSELVSAATWHWLPPLTEEQLLAWTGPATSDVVTWLLELTTSRSGETRRRWQDWQSRRVIERHSEGTWRFAGDYDPALDIDGLLEGRIRALVGSGYQEIAAAHRVLGCAALEGRQFTAPAVALAIDRADREVMALLETLVVDERRPNGLLRREAPNTIVTASGARNLAVYRFVRELDWRAMRHHGMNPGSQRHHAATLVHALQELYGAGLEPRAETLARLCVIAGDNAGAHRFERLAGMNAAGRIVLWRARNALHSPRPSDPIARDRLARHLIDGAKDLDGHGQFAEGLEFGRAAQQLAQTRRNRARAVYAAARHLMWLAAYAEARREFTRALELYLALGLDGLRGQAGSRLGIAICERAEGQIGAAREGYAAALAIFRDIGDRAGEANALQGIADCDRSQSKLGPAQDGHEAALAIYRDIGDRVGEARAVNDIAVGDRLRGRIGAARVGYEAALTIYRDIGNRVGEANVLQGIAICDQLQDEIGSARDRYEAALAIHRDIGDRIGEADALQGIADCDRLQGEIRSARDGHEAALAIYRDTGRRAREANALTGIAICDRSQGEIGSARDGHEAALAIYCDVGDRIGEANALNDIAICDRLQREIRRARDHHEAALAIYRDVGDRKGEANALTGIAECDQMQGRG